MEFFTYPDTQNIYRALAPWITGHNAACVAGGEFGKAVRAPLAGRIPAEAPNRIEKSTRMRERKSADIDFCASYVEPEWVEAARGIATVAHGIRPLHEFVQWARVGDVAYFRVEDRASRANEIASCCRTFYGKRERRGQPGKHVRCSTSRMFIRVKVVGERIAK